VTQLYKTCIQILPFFSIPKKYDVNFLIIISSVLSSISEIVKKILSSNSEILFLLSNQ
jgi:hypothetical protein